MEENEIIEEVKEEIVEEVKKEEKEEKEEIEVGMRVKTKEHYDERHAPLYPEMTYLVSIVYEDTGMCKLIGQNHMMYILHKDKLIIVK